MRNSEIVRTSGKSVDLNNTNAHVLSIERIQIPHPSFNFQAYMDNQKHQEAHIQVTACFGHETDVLNLDSSQSR